MGEHDRVARDREPRTGAARAEGERANPRPARGAQDQRAGVERDLLLGSATDHRRRDAPQSDDRGDGVPEMAENVVGPFATAEHDRALERRTTVAVGHRERPVGGDHPRSVGASEEQGRVVPSRRDHHVPRTDLDTAGGFLEAEEGEPRLGRAGGRWQERDGGAGREVGPGNRWWVELSIQQQRSAAGLHEPGGDLAPGRPGPDDRHVDRLTNGKLVRATPRHRGPVRRRTRRGAV